MLTVLVTAVSAVAATRGSIQGQYYGQLASDATESGLAMAKACMSAGSDTWANPLRPSSTCTGLAAQCTTANCYLSYSDELRVTFSVSSPATAGNIISIKVTGQVERMRASSGQIWRTYSSSLSRQETKAVDRGLQWKQISTGGAHSCAIASDNMAYCWGLNTDGQLGDSTTTQRIVPTVVSQGALPAGATFRSISAGQTHTCAIASDNKLYCWGNNASGQLGDNTESRRLAPVAVVQGAMPAGSTVKDIATSDQLTCAIASDSKAYCWGNGWTGQIGDGVVSFEHYATAPIAVSQGAMPAGSTVRSLKAGPSNVCVVASNNKAYCWGANTQGEIGNGTLTSKQATPVAVSLGSMPGGSTIRDISVGAGFACAVASDNKAYCWGSNTNGRLGDGTTTQRTSPVTVAQGTMPAGSTILQISSFDSHSCAVASDNKAYCWGLNTNGRLGDGATTQRTSPATVAQGTVPAGFGIRQISAGGTHTCAIATNNQTYCWGLNTNGRLGDSSVAQRLTPVTLALANDARERPTMDLRMALSGPHSCAIASDSRAYCWGNNSYGKLGDGTTSNRLSPVAVLQGDMPDGAMVRDLTSNGEHSCAVASNGKAYCWGNGSDGRLGSGSNADRLTAYEVAQGAMPAGSMVIQVTTGGYHSCALATSFKAYCWGSNSYGKLGDGTTTGKSVPAAVAQGAMPTGSTFRQISDSGEHTCGVGSDNKAYCWGLNTDGQIGNNLTTQQTSPAAVSQGAMPAGVTFKKVAVNGNYSCGIGSDDKVYCWGANTDRQLGNGSAVTRSLTPVAVSQGAMPAGATILQISAGYYHVCVVASNYKAYCWGGNTRGELGIGSTNNYQPTPVEVQRGQMPVGATIKEISAGDYHTCAVASDNKAYCWGSNGSGELGDNTTVQRLTPTAIQPFPPYPPLNAGVFYF